MLSFFISIFTFFGYILKSGLAGSYGNSIVTFLRKLHTLFHSSGTNLHSHQCCTNDLFSLHPRQHLLFVVFLMMAILMDVRIVVSFYPTVVWICIFLINDAEHLSPGLLAICISSLENCLFRSSVHFKIRLFFWCWVVLFWMLSLLILSFANIFSQSVTVFSFCEWFPLLWN